MKELELLIDKSEITRLTLSHTSRDTAHKMTKIHLLWTNLTNNKLLLEPVSAVIINKEGVQKDLKLLEVAFLSKTFLLDDRFITILPKLSREFIVGLNDGYVKLTENAIIALEYKVNNKSDVTVFQVKDLYPENNSKENLEIEFSEGNVKVLNGILTVGDDVYKLNSIKEAKFVNKSLKYNLIGSIVFLLGLFTAIIIVGFFIMAYGLKIISKKEKMYILLTRKDNTEVKIFSDDKNHGNHIVNFVKKKIV